MNVKIIGNILNCFYGFKENIISLRKKVKNMLNMFLISVWLRMRHKNNTLPNDVMTKCNKYMCTINNQYIFKYIRFFFLTCTILYTHGFARPCKASAIYLKNLY